MKKKALEKNTEQMENINTSEENNKEHSCHCEKCNNHKEKTDKEKCSCKDNDKETLEELKKTILNLTEEKEELENKLMYSKAELVNYRKRKDEETQNMLKFANQDLIMELLVVLDNFERAMASMKVTDETSKVMEGIQMIYNHLNETLKNFGVTEIEAKDKPFDSNYHEAVMTANDKEKDNEIVVNVLLKGYMLKNRVIRAAKVVVNNLD